MDIDQKGVIPAIRLGSTNTKWFLGGVEYYELPLAMVEIESTLNFAGLDPNSEPNMVQRVGE